MQVGASSCKSPRDGGGGGAGLGGRKLNGEGRTSGEPGAETRTTAQASGRQGQGHQQVRSDGSGEEYCTGGADEVESADESVRCSGADSEGSATEEDVMTTEGTGWDSKPRTAPAGWTLEIGADTSLGDAMAGGCDTGKASSAAADEAGAGGRHGARLEQRGGLQASGDIRPESPQECGTTTGATRPPEWPTSPW